MLSETDYNIFQNVSAIKPTRFEAENFTRMSSAPAPEACGEGGYNIGTLNAGEWLTYQVNIPESGVYDLVLRYAAAGEVDASIDVLVDDQKAGAVENMTLFTGGWQTWDNSPAVKLNLPAGRHTLKLQYNAGGSNLNWFELHPTGLSEVGITEVTDPAGQIAVLGTPFESLNLPETVGVKLETGDTISVPVTWQPGNYNGDVRGVYRLDGILQPSKPIVNELELTASLQMTVSKLVPVAAEGVSKVKAAEWTTANGASIENCLDEDGGQNVFGLQAGSWMTYHIDAAQAGYYDFTARVAGADQGISFDILLDGEAAGSFRQDSATGGAQSWETAAPVSVKVPAGLHELKILVTDGGMNINWFGFEMTQAIHNIAAVEPVQLGYVGYGTPFDQLLLPESASVQLDNGDTAEVPVIWNEAEYDSFAYGGQTISGQFVLGDAFTNPNGLTVSASMEVISAHNIDPLQFTRMEAENWSYTSDWVQTEDCTDEGGGLNTSWTNAGEWITYHINVSEAGNYLLNARVAAQNPGNAMDISVDGVPMGTITHADGTGTWQTWDTTGAIEIYLPAGVHELRLDITEGGMNINWLGFERVLPNLSIQSDRYPVDEENSIVSGISAGTAAADILSSLRCAEEGAVLQIADADGNQLSGDAVVKTGMKVQVLFEGKVGKEYGLSVLGDLGVSEQPGVKDLLMIKSHILGRESLSQLQTASADLNADGRINIFDLVELKFMILRG
ncbi:carbohydrate-binding protein [Candidatus Soleaferrea massiliensis]|uniref:carbohydrate-binding protein n=1 Tax=Candidatus Soleaferrea massiliensis TaxID=1470354 RepID=UPI0024189105|nr:carbohydrate-binding protein [Candidatus Soleaferrea massiliensis]